MERVVTRTSASEYQRVIVAKPGDRLHGLVQRVAEETRVRQDVAQLVGKLVGIEMPVFLAGMQMHLVLAFRPPLVEDDRIAFGVGYDDRCAQFFRQSRQ